MDLSSKIVIGIAMILGAIYVRRKLSAWLNSRSNTFQSALMIVPVVLLSIISISETKEPFWLGHIIVWSILWGIVLFVLFGSSKVLLQSEAAVASGERQADAPPAHEEHLNVVDYVIPEKDFSNVHGMVEFKKTLNETTQDILEKGQNGVLFYGPPGNGKTHFAECYAGELNKFLPKGKRTAFLTVSIAELQATWVGQTTQQITATFAAAAAAAKKEGACVLFIDEIDSILIRREQMIQVESEAGRSVNAMLTLVVKYRDFKKYGIVIMGATNFIDRLDGAAVRDGRFDFKHLIPAPDELARLKLLCTNSKAAHLPEAVAKRAAKRWEGFNVARLMSVGRIAGENAEKAKRQEVTFDDLMLALREVQGNKGLGLKEGTMSLDQLRFDPEQRDRLKNLANRLNRIVEIEDMGGTVPKGVLFFGPPGTGKTAVAQALALESQWAYLAVAGNDLLNNKGELEKLMDRASDLRPCIVFIDEADDILMDRKDNPWGRSDTNKLLSLMDGNKALQDVLFIAATNHKEDLDPAAVRGGRFSEHFEFELPDDDSLLAIINRFMVDKAMAPWAPDFTPAAAMDILSGMSPADAKDRLQQAINRTVARLDNSLITLDDLRAVA